MTPPLTKLERALVHTSSQDRLAIVSALFFVQDNPDFVKHYGTYGKECVDNLLNAQPKVK